MSNHTYTIGASLPDYPFAVYDSSGTLLNFATGWTFSAAVSVLGSTTALFTKSTNITGAATSPNITLSWATSGELTTLAAGTYTVQVTATRTSDTRVRIVTGPLTMKAAIA